MPIGRRAPETNYCTIPSVLDGTGLNWTGLLRTAVEHGILAPDNPLDMRVLCSFSGASVSEET